MSARRDAVRVHDWSPNKAQPCGVCGQDAGVSETSRPLTAKGGGDLDVALPLQCRACGSPHYHLDFTIRVVNGIPTPDRFGKVEFNSRVNLIAWGNLSQGQLIKATSGLARFLESRGHQAWFHGRVATTYTERREMCRPGDLNYSVLTPGAFSEKVKDASHLGTTRKITKSVISERIETAPPTVENLHYMAVLQEVIPSWTEEKEVLDPRTGKKLKGRDETGNKRSIKAVLHAAKRIPVLSKITESVTLPERSVRTRALKGEKTGRRADQKIRPARHERDPRVRDFLFDGEGEE